MQRLLLAALFLATAACAQAQKAYFQQRVDTRIQVKLDDEQHLLYGFEEITYTNHSPDTLAFLYIHLWPNAYLNDRTPYAQQQMQLGNKDFFYAKAEDRGYIDSLSFRVNGLDATFETLPGAPDIARLQLPQALQPGQALQIETPFRVKIPRIFSRLGHSGQAYYISQWFPKPAVYDRHGWHPVSYLDQGEFYSEIGSYEVSITLPKNYVLLATGNCQQPEEAAWMQALSKQPVAVPRNKAAFPPSDTAYKTLTFKEDNIHDFAWFTDKRWALRYDTAVVDGRTVDIWAAFLPAENTRWHQATGFLKTTLDVYGNEVGPYPYRTIKAVEGDMKAGGGMEYPTITIIDRAAGKGALDDVLAHEAGHNWFYGILASNERQFPWMDEGVNSFYEKKTTARINGLSRAEIFSSQSLSNLLYYQLAASRQDQAAALPAPAYRELNYGADVYFKPPLLLDWLEAWMGPEHFRAAMRDYYQTWKFRHPYPEDMQAVFQKHSREDVSWFFTGALHTDKPIDFKVVRKGANNYLIQNKSGFAAPAVLDVYVNDSVVRHISTAPFAHEQVISLQEGERLALSPTIPDLNRKNNGYRHGGFRPAIGLGLGLQKQEKIYLLPAPGYNVYDGFMLGPLLHNISLPEHRFKYALAPLYGFGSKSWAGAGSVAYSFYPGKIFQEIIAQADAKSFHYQQSGLNISQPLYARYEKVAPSLNFIFKEKNPLSTVTRTLLLRGYFIREENFNFYQDGTDSLYRPALFSSQKLYGRLSYEHQNERLFNPFSYKGELVMGNTFATLSLEGNIKIDYNLRNKAFYARAFAGKLFPFTSEPIDGRYSLNMTSTAGNDFLYDELFFGRSEQEGVAAHQIVIAGGGFKIPTPRYAHDIGESEDWLAAINLKTDLPLGKLPLRLFFDAGTFANAAKLNPSGSNILFAGGLELHLLGDFFTLHLPLVMSEDYRDYFRSVLGRNSPLDALTFSLQFNGQKLLQLPRQALKLAGN